MGTGGVGGAGGGVEVVKKEDFCGGGGGSGGRAIGEIVNIGSIYAVCAVGCCVSA